MQREISLNTASVSGLLGIALSPAGAVKILKALGFEVKKKKSGIFSVKVPSFRQDIKTETDLAEEIARIYGYENIQPTLPRMTAQQLNIKDTRSLVSLIKNTLVALGLNEVVTYSLIDRKLLRDLKKESLNPVEIANPLSGEQEVLRPTLIPSLLKCVAYNLNQKQEYVNIFEIARAFSFSGKGIPEERLVLGLALCGVKPYFISEQGAVKEEMGLLHLKGVLEALFGKLGIKDWPDQQIFGMMEMPGKDILSRFDIKNKGVAIAEVYLDKLLSSVNMAKKFASLPLYPGITRDISLVLKEEIPAGEILAAIKEKAGLLFREARIVDFYKGKQIPQGSKSLTISCFYRSDERTLAETEINPAHSLICAFLTEKFQAKIR